MPSWRQFRENYERNRKDFDEKNFQKVLLFAVLVGALISGGSIFILDEVLHYPQHRVLRAAVGSFINMLLFLPCILWAWKRWPPYKNPPAPPT